MISSLNQYLVVTSDNYYIYIYVFQFQKVRSLKISSAMKAKGAKETLHAFSELDHPYQNSNA